MRLVDGPACMGVCGQMWDNFAFAIYVLPFRWIRNRSAKSNICKFVLSLPLVLPWAAEGTAPASGYVAASQWICSSRRYAAAHGYAAANGYVTANVYVAANAYVAASTYVAAKIYAAAKSHVAAGLYTCM